MVFSKTLLLTAFLPVLLLSGCSSSWKAPVSSYSSPAPQKASVSKGAIKGGFYRVESGDTLYSIAWRSGKDYKTLARWNGLRSPYVIYEDQVLRLKPPAKKSSTTAKQVTAAPPKKPVAHKPVAHKPAAKPATGPRPVDEPKTAAKKTPQSTTPSVGKYHTRLNWRWPTKGKIIKSFKAGDDSRKGIVVSGNAGQPIVAAESGKVVYSGSGLIGYGQLIIIKHNDNYLSAYGYNRKLLVSEGDWITKGKQIATMGTFNNAVPSLHFEIRKNGNPVNPLRVLP